MRKILFLILLLFSATMFAQTSDNVNVSIVLRHVQSIVVNPTQKNVELVYDSETKYASGIISNQQEHLKVFSSAGFAIQVKSNSPSFEGIELGDMKVMAEAVNPNPNYSFSEVILSQTATDLIVSGRGGRNLLFNIVYDNAGGSDKYFDKEAKSYTADVQYSILPQ